MNDVTINIYGGNNQILPNATEAVQNFYVNDHAGQLQVTQTTSASFSPEAEKLTRYFAQDRIPGFLAQIRGCNSATELAKVVVSMLDQDSKLTEEIVVKEIFIQLLLPLATKLTTGKSINNLRARINDALIARRKSHPKH